jgi:NAD(P)-dependent dehydrogenase (short-subunit alcohol dehydrogenase family)
MKEPQTHTGRIAVVTGAARGIGYAVATKLAQRGARVALVDLERPHAQAAALPGQALAIAADVSSEAGWAHIGERVRAQLGDADIIVNNAGIYPQIALEDLDYQKWRHSLAVNLDSNYFSAREFVPGMRKKKWGRFVNISSNSIGTNLPGLSHYMAAKMGVLGFVRGLANEVGQDGITVNAIVPALTNTPGTSKVPEELKRSVWQLQAIKRFAEPEDIAGPIVFLTSDDAAFVTGQALVADGGMYKIS